MATPSKLSYEEKVNIYESAESPKPNCIIIKKKGSKTVPSKKLKPTRKESSSCKKRKNSADSVKDSDKKRRVGDNHSKEMDSKTMPENIEELIRKASAEAVGAANESIKTQLDISLLPIKTSMEQLVSRELERDKKMDRFEADLKVLKESNTAERLKETVRAEITSMEDTKCAASHKLYLVGLIDKVSSNLIVHGLEHKDPLQAVTDMIDKLNIPEAQSRIRIKSAHALGKRKDASTPSIHVTLGSQYDRNEILKHARFLPKTVHVEKDIPHAYREKNKQMKRRAWRLRTYMNVQTQIMFINHCLTLRYRDSDDKNKSWLIYEEFYPSIQDVLNKQGGNTSDYGPPSKVITKSELEKANRTLVLANLRGQTKAQAEVFIGSILGEKISLIEEVIAKEKFTLIRCTKQESVSEIIALCKNGKVDNENLRCDSFND